MLEAGLIDPTTTAATRQGSPCSRRAWRGDVDRRARAHARVGRGGHDAGARIHARRMCDYAQSVLYNGLGNYALAADLPRRPVPTRISCRSPSWRSPNSSRPPTTVSSPNAPAAAANALSAVAAASGSDFALGKAAHARALTAEGDAVDRLFQEAIERLGRSRLASHLPRARLNYGEWLRAADRRDEAREQLQVGPRRLCGHGRQRLRRTRQTPAARHGGEGAQANRPRQHRPDAAGGADRSTRASAAHQPRDRC